MEREITFTIDVPVQCTEDELYEWLCFNLHKYGGCSMQNPLVEYEIEAKEVNIR